MTWPVAPPSGRLFWPWECPNQYHPTIGICGPCGHETMHEGDCCESCLQDFEYDPGFRVDDECCCRAFKDHLRGTRADI